MKSKLVCQRFIMIDLCGAISVVFRFSKKWKLTYFEISTKYYDRIPASLFFLAAHRNVNALYFLNHMSLHG